MTPNRRLKQARELRGWSQAKVAERIGTDATTVSRWERGLFLPTPYFREKLCALFDKNAEELGLLETSQLPELEHKDSTPQLSSVRSSDLAHGQWGGDEELYAEATVSLAPPSWPKRTDTFTYILHSAAHDQQAHMLWEDAYVRALRGQRTEAQRLGEASMSAFEHIGHNNAGAIREWLDQRELVAAQPATTSPSSLPLPMLTEQRKRPARRIVRRRGTGIALILLLLLVVIVAGVSFNQLYTTVQASQTLVRVLTATPRLPHLTPTFQTGVSLPAALAGNVTPTSQAAPSATLTITTSTSPGKATPATSSSLNATVTPGNLNPQTCVAETSDYRCTVTLMLFSSANGGTFHWSASSTNGQVHILSPTTGTGSTGQFVQVIMYLVSSQGQKGQIVFQFSISTNQPVTTSSISWQD